jgi:type II pantothenate kinase
MSMPDRVAMRDAIAGEPLLPHGAAGIDAGLTLLKVARCGEGGIELSARETGATAHGDVPASAIVHAATRIGITGARGDRIIDGTGVVRVQEIEAAAHGAIALLGAESPREFVLALLGTGTAFAAVRDGSVTHLGGTAMGGGSFAGIARRIDLSLSYGDMIACAARGERRNVDLMVSDAYADGIGRIGGDLTAAHLAKPGGSVEDVLAALLNLHGENIAQIAAGRGQAVGIRNVVMAGGFAHDNAPLVSSITAMLRLFSVESCVTPHAGFAGAVGAALAAGNRQGG